MDDCRILLSRGIIKLQDVTDIELKHIIEENRQDIASLSGYSNAANKFFHKVRIYLEVEATRRKELKCQN